MKHRFIYYKSAFFVLLCGSFVYSQQPALSDALDQLTNRLKDLEARLKGEVPPSLPPAKPSAVMQRVNSFSSLSLITQAKFINRITEVLEVDWIDQKNKALTIDEKNLTLYSKGTIGYDENIKVTLLFDSYIKLNQFAQDLEALMKNELPEDVSTQFKKWVDDRSDQTVETLLKMSVLLDDEVFPSNKENIFMAISLRTTEVAYQQIFEDIKRKLLVQEQDKLNLYNLFEAIHVAAASANVTIGRAQKKFGKKPAVPVLPPADSPRILLNRIYVFAKDPIITNNDIVKLFQKLVEFKVGGQKEVHIVPEGLGASVIDTMVSQLFEDYVQLDKFKNDFESLVGGKLDQETQASFNEWIEKYANDIVRVLDNIRKGEQAKNIVKTVYPKNIIIKSEEKGVQQQFEKIKEKVGGEKTENLTIYNLVAAIDILASEAKTLIQNQPSKAELTKVVAMIRSKQSVERLERLLDNRLTPLLGSMLGVVALGEKLMYLNQGTQAQLWPQVQDKTKRPQLLQSGQLANLYFSDAIERYKGLEIFKNQVKQLNATLFVTGDPKERFDRWISKNGNALVEALTKIKNYLEKRQGEAHLRFEQFKLLDLPEDMKQFGTLNEFLTGLKSLCDGLMKVIQESITKEA